jgi:hypothetical protein
MDRMDKNPYQSPSISDTGPQRRFWTKRRTMFAIVVLPIALFLLLMIVGRIVFRSAD